MTTIEKPTANKETLEQMISRADLEIASLRKEIEQANGHIYTINAELATISAKREARATLLATAQSTVDQARTTVEQLTTQVKIAEGTAAYTDLVKQLADARKRVKANEEECADLIEREQPLEEADLQRIDELKGQHAQSVDLASNASNEIDALERARRETFATIGDLEYADVVRQIEQARNAIATKEQEIEQEREDLRALIYASIERLDRWPVHYQQIRKERPPMDATARVIANCLAYVDSLLTDGPHVTDNLNMLPCASAYGSWLQLIEVSRRELYIYEHLKGPNTLLSKKHQDLKLLLEQYIASKM